MSKQILFKEMGQSKLPGIARIINRALLLAACVVPIGYAVLGWRYLILGAPLILIYPDSSSVTLDSADLSTAGKLVLAVLLLINLLLFAALFALLSRLMQDFQKNEVFVLASIRTLKNVAILGASWTVIDFVISLLLPITLANTENVRTPVLNWTDILQFDFSSFLGSLVFLALAEVMKEAVAHAEELKSVV